MSIPVEIDLPWSSPPLSLNQRQNWRVKANNTRMVRDTAMLLAKQSKFGTCERIEVTLHYRPRDRRTRDAENPVATLKALCDGLVDAGIVADDDPGHMVKNMPVIHEATSVSGLKPRLWLVIDDLTSAEAS